MRLHRFIEQRQNVLLLGPTGVGKSHIALPGIPGADIRFVQGDVKPIHAEMTRVAGIKNIWIVGGGELAGQFYDAHLLDEAIISAQTRCRGIGGDSWRPPT